MDLISRQAAIDALECINGVEEVLRSLPTAQPYTIHSDGRLWVTVDDIDKVNAVVVDESKSKFCKQFYMDAQPEIIYCKDCKHNPNLSWFGCPMSHLSEAQRPETAWCWKAERREVTE